MPKFSFDKTPTMSWLAMVSHIFTSKASWQIVRKLIGTLCALCMALAIQRFLWTGINGLVIFIRNNCLRNIQNRILSISYETSINTFASNIKMPHLCKGPRQGILLSRLGGRHRIVHLKMD